MNKTRRTRQITIETHSITVIRTRGAAPSGYCEQCRRNVAVFTPEQIADFFCLTSSEVCRNIEARQIHLTRSEGGTAALICGDSLGTSSNK